MNFRDVSEFVDYLAIHPSEAHAIYWRCSGGSPACVMAFFNEDGSAILGISCVEEEAERWLTELRVFTEMKMGCVLFEQPPPDSYSAFRSLCDRLA